MTLNLRTFLLIVAAICFVIGAFVFGGADVFHSVGWQWVAGGLSATVLSAAVP